LRKVAKAIVTHAISDDARPFLHPTQNTYT
jgi:hypothetical protein